jgi:hypothetical protein
LGKSPDEFFLDLINITLREDRERNEEEYKSERMALMKERDETKET